MGSYTSPPIRVIPQKFENVELVFGGVEQAGPSFEGRAFVNNPDADDSTPRDPEHGYAGSFHVYGYGDPSVAPPAVAAAKERGEGPAAPIEKRLRADPEAVRAALGSADELTVTVVPVAAGEAVPERPFEDVEIVFDRAGTQAY